MMNFPDLPRRSFLKAVGVLPLLGTSRYETAATRFFRSLSREQLAVLAFPFDHPLRSVARNNWRVVEPRIADLPPFQRSLCREILDTACTPEGLAKLDRQMRDDGGGFDRYHVAIFGDPDQSRAQWVMTGRHLTLRVDATTGRIGQGPLFLGHSAKAEDNIWQGPGRTASAIFNAIPAKPNGRERVTIDARDDMAREAIRRLSRELVEPFRRFESAEVTDRDRALWSVTFFGDGSIWKLAGPEFAWHYHALPHVHCWLTA